MALVKSVVSAHSPLYAKARSLRERLLRKPLGLELSPQDTAHDESSLHCVLLEGEAVVATAVVTPEPDCNRARISQVVVEEPYQRKGMGRMVMELAESTALEHGFTRCYLEARDNVLGFYRQSGYEPQGQPFVKLRILHHPLEKHLTRDTLQR